MEVKRKKQNKWLPLVCLVLVMAALFVSYKLLSASNERKAAEEAAKAAEENTVIAVADYDPTLVTSLSYENKGEEPLSFIRKDGAWQVAGDEHFPLNGEFIDTLAETISSIGALRTVEEGEAADYGLTEPMCSIEVGYADGTQHSYRIGDYNTFGGGYYFMADGAISMISSSLLSAFGYTLDDLAVLDTMPAYEWTTEGVVTALTISRGADEVTITDQDRILQVTRAIHQLVKLNDCADYYADADEKTAAYGYGDAVKVTMAYKEPVTTTDAEGNTTAAYMDTTYTIWFGADTGDGSTCYGGPDHSDLVYRLNAEAAGIMKNDMAAELARGKDTADEND